MGNPVDDTINSNVPPSELAEINKFDAKQFDIVLSVIINEMPSRIDYINTLIDETKAKLKSLKTKRVVFDADKSVENVSKDYSKFAETVINVSAEYELNMIGVINLFNKQNGSKEDLEYSYLLSLPALGSLLFTFLTYFGNGDYYDDAPQFVRGLVGLWRTKDFNAQNRTLQFSLANLALKYFGLEGLQSIGLAGLAVIGVEGIGIALEDSEPGEKNVKMTKVLGGGVKLVGGSMWAQYVAAPAGAAASSYVFSILGGSGAAKALGLAAGCGTGALVAVTGTIIIAWVVDPIVDYVTGERLIGDTSIPYNGGDSYLYSKYLREADKVANGNPYNSRNTHLYGMTVSSEYAKIMAQNDPVDTVMGLDEAEWYEGEYSQRVLENYIEGLEAIPKDSPDFEKQVDSLTVDARIGESGDGYGSDLVSMLLDDLGFDPVEYARTH